MRIREATNLSLRIGPGRVDQIAFHEAGAYTPSTNRVRCIQNPHFNLLVWDRYGAKPWVVDIIEGVSQLDYGTDSKLSPIRLYAVLKSAPVISTELLANVMNISDRQARRYLAGVKLAIFHISRHLRQTTEVKHVQD